VGRKMGVPLHHKKGVGKKFPHFHLFLISIFCCCFESLKRRGNHLEEMKNSSFNALEKGGEYVFTTTKRN
jgi:hypothetical protein